MKKIKVLFVLGGSPHYFVSLLNKFQSNYNVEVVTLIPDTRSSTLGAGVKELKEGIQYKVIRSKEVKNLLGKVYFKDFYKIIKEERPDVIVIGWPYIVGLLTDIKSLWFIKKNKIAIVLREIPFLVPPRNKFISYYKENPPLDENLNNMAPKGLKFYLWAFGLMLIRSLYYKIADITLNYTKQGKEIQESYGVKPENIFFMGNTPDVDELFQAKKELENEIESKHEKKGPVLIHVGRLVKWKYVDLLIKAIAHLKQDYPDISLIIIGKGPEEENLRKLAKELNVEENVKFVGAIYDYKEMGKWFRLADIYVLAGRGGLSINEAMAFGKPIICTFADGTEKTLVREGKNGYIFKEGDLNDLINKIKILLDNPQKIQEFGKESERIIREEENPQTVLERLYKAILFVFNKKRDEKNN